MPKGPTLSLDIFKTARKVSAREVVLWIFDNIDIKDLEPCHAPSPGAWSFLIQIRKDIALRREFYKSIWPKLLPSKAQIEVEDRQFDDGREDALILSRIDSLVSREDDQEEEEEDDSREV